ncbi:methyl-accepting chemotaxis protein [Actinoplanes oblitus]|uniref:Methyl-accepting chemotaxis protein n=1 Tax=Actinoplanes oblitus TaxID=3040509 RepID=A0ABY8WSL5_9ACTN|nr:methyl-accepting chemotaxis protein [Actinoplanes oblitus]WIM99568.1 methyl-accepting chemotaxis protein [Actinoplanes oblitus]
MSQQTMIKSGWAGRLRWTIAAKITTLVVIAVGLLLALGLLGVLSVSDIRTLATQQAMLSDANARLIDMDMQESNATIALNRALLSTTDAARQQADTLLGNAATAARADMAAIATMALTGAAHNQLTAVAAAYEKYLGEEDDAVATAKTVDPAGAAAIRLLADDDKRAGATEEVLTDARANLDGMVVKATEEADAKATSVKVVVGVSLLVAVLLLGGIGWGLVRAVRTALYRLRDRMTDIAEGEGDLTARLPDLTNDETGDVARAVNTFIARVQQVVAQMAGAAETLDGSVQTLGAMTTQMSANAEQTSTQAGTVTRAAEDVSRNVSTLSAGSEEMTASIREISVNASEAAQVAGTAVGIASTARDTVAALSTASSEISNVVKLITSIAEQTNLLALNATIEAARAGESGKGFAVVAGEVKELAQETAKATDDITQRVAAIQAGTDAAVGAISTVADIVGRISDFSTTIASAVEEQTATTNEMSRNVTETAEAAGQIAVNITQVSEGAASTSAAAGEAAHTTSTIATVVGDLKTTVGRFRY